MHQDTFEDLTDDVQAARREWQGAMDEQMRSMFDDLDDDLGMPVPPPPE